MWLGWLRCLGQRHAAGAGGVEGGVNAAVTGATLGEGVLLWLQRVQGVEPAIVAVAAGCVAGEGIAAGVTGVLRLPLEGKGSVLSLDPRAGDSFPFLGSSLCLSVTPGVRQLTTLALYLIGHVTLGKCLSFHTYKMGLITLPHGVARRDK